MEEEFEQRKSFGTHGDENKLIKQKQRAVQSADLRAKRVVCKRIKNASADVYV